MLYLNVMQTQSGYFGELPSGADLLASGWEVIHTSGSGINVLYKNQNHGRSRLFKGLKPELRGNHLYEELLRKEFEIGYSLNHPAICEYYSFGHIPDKGLCIGMEWIEGQTLEARLNDGLSETLCRKILVEICDALDYMHHRQVFHRDLKPENIMITNKGNNAKIIDFGFSDADVIQFGREPAGTAAYAAPELLSKGVVDGRSDIYSLGLIMLRMPSAFYSIAKKCTCEKPEDRYQTAAAVKKALLEHHRPKWIIPVVLAILAIAAAVLIMTPSAPDQEMVKKEPIQEDLVKEEPEQIDQLFEETQNLIRDFGIPAEVQPE